MRAEQSASASDQPLLESLEQRMLFSAEPFGLGADLFSSADDPLSDDTRDITRSTHGYELVLINDNLDDIDTLITDLHRQIEAGRNIVVQVLDSGMSGMDQIANILPKHDSIKAVHMLSHGNTEGVQLGSSWIDRSSIDAYASSFAVWNDYLSDQTQLLFYGCDLAASKDGTDLLGHIASITGAMVAASSDSTGHELLHGDWDLEYRTNSFQIEPLLSDDAEDAWLSELATYSYRNADGSYSQAIDTHLSEANASQSNGSSGELAVSSISTASQQALLRFDDLIGGVGDRIAPGTTVASATLTLEISNPAASGSQASIHQMLQHWDEYTTWSQLGTGVQTDDNEAASALLAQFSADATGTVTIDVTSSVQGWLNGAPNYGWLITSDANASELRVHSSDSPQTALRPQLTIVTSSGLVVTTTNDDVDGDTSSISALEASPGGDGEISLREAVIATNNTAGADTIFLPAGNYEFAISGGDELAASGDLDILDELTITGAGRDATIIDANDIHRHFDVRDDNGFASLTLEDLTLTDGSFDWGGAVSVHTGMSLSLDRVNVTDNTTDSAGNGGAIHNLGTLSITDSVFERNYAANKEGGAIYAEGSVVITGSTFTDNSSNHGGALQFGGTTLTISDSDFHTNLSTDRGGALDLNDGTTTILRSSLHNNTAEDGGAINMDGSAKLKIEQSTISGNKANVEGGGIRARGGGNTLDIISSTIAYNDASNDGGGLDNHNGDVTTTVTNSIFQGNTKNNETNPEAFRDNSNLSSGGYNTISDGTSNFSSTGDQTTQDANLNQTLTYPSGSNVAVHTLYADSPARDSGQPSVTTTDNSGHPRVGAPDRGAAESYSSPVTHTVSAPAIDGEVDALWNNAQAEPLLDYSGDVTTPPTNPGATWRATWSDEALYLLVEVSDNTPYEDSADIWHDDAIAVYLDPDVSRSTSYDGVDDTNFYIGRSHDTITLVNDPLLLTNVSVATIDTLDGYSKEIAIPWSELGITPTAGTQIGIELHLNDDADGGNNNTELLWADSQDRAWTDPSSFGAIVLDAANDSAGPDGLNHGIAINTDGGNNTWFQAPTSVTQGLESYTVQTRFTTSTVQGLSIIPWVTAGVSYFLTADMANNTPRTHTEVWDAATGTKTGYIDGVQIRQDTYAHLAGTTVTTSHPLVIGQNNTGGQTSLNTSAFNPARFFSGTIHDVRVYDYALAPDEIDQNLHRQFSAENPPTGLIANWRFDRLTGDNNDRVVDLINPGINDMIVQQLAADGSTWIDSTPSDQIIINDDVQTNDVAGYVHPTDADVIDESYTYALIDDANGRFDINRTTGQLLVADGSLIEGGTSSTRYAVTIRVTDESGNTFDRRLTIQADPVNEAPTLTGLPSRYTTYHGGGEPVTLGDGLLPEDPELTMLDSYGGFEITLASDSGADAEDVFSLGNYASGADIVWADGGGVTIGSILQNAGGTLQLQFNASATADAVRDTVRAIRYENTGDASIERRVLLKWTLDDNNIGGAQGSGLAVSETLQTVEIKPQYFEAVDDVLGGTGVVSGSGNYSFPPSAVTDNDLGKGIDTPFIVSTTDPTIGTLNNVSGSYEFSTMAGETGTSTFGYLAAIGNADMISQWPLLTDGADDAQRNNGTLVSDSPAHELQFDGDDYLQIANIDYPNEWTLTFDFKVNDLDHGLSETFFANGKYGASNSLHVWISGKSHWTPSNRGMLITHIKDSTDSDFGWSGYKYDVTGFEEDGQWHNYAIVVREGTGTSIYIDGVEQDTSSATRGEAPFNPTDPVYVGVGDHSIIGFDSWLTHHQLANMRLLNGFDEPAIQANELNQYSTGTVSITVRNEESLDDNNSITVSEDQTRKILNTALQTTDIDDPPSALTYTVDTAPAFGTLLLNGAALDAGDSFTQQQIDDEALSYHHNGSETATSDSFDFTVDDGVGSATTDTFSLTLNPLNDAPVLGDGSLTDADEDSTPAGDTITNIFTGQLVDNDGTLAGIAITADSSTTEGWWRYSTDNGASWYNVGTVSTSLALILDTGSLLHFLPAANFNGTAPALTLYGIDNTYTGSITNGVARALVDVTIRGGTTPYALDASTINTSITAVNDAPVLDGLPTTNPRFIAGGDAVPLGSGLFASDIELAATGNYDGLELILERSGGAVTDDQFDLGSAASGSDLSYTDLDTVMLVGSIIQNSGGTLHLIFNSGAGDAAVREVLQSISYRFAGTVTSASSIELTWTLSDGNTGSQGSGGTQTSIVTSDVDITQSFPTAPTALGHGISINTDGGNDTYLLADDGGALLGGLTAVTMEAHYSIDTMNTRNALISYNAITTADTLKLLVRSNGVVDVGVMGIDVLSDPVPQLLDGERHSVAATWDADGGHLRMYVDGELVHATTGIASGQTLQTGGTLILGMEQDSPGGGFELSEILSGSLYDVRLWNTVRAEHEIAASHHQRFDTATLPDELIANWQMDGVNGDGRIVDVVSGNQLSIRHTTGTGFSTSTPVTDLTVAEGATNGTELGSLVVSTPAPPENLVRDPNFAYTGAAVIAQYNTGEVIGDAGVWLVDSGNVELLGDYQTTPMRGYGIDLDGVTPGAISQTLSTEVGRTYQINFAFAGNFDVATDKSLRVSAGTTSNDFSQAMPSGWTKDNLLWQQRSMRFTATSTDTTLIFTSLSASGSDGPIIGDVSVVELTDPVANLLNANPNLTYDPNTGKFYQLTATPETWATAQATAVATEINGVAGQLVTIGSEYENTLVRTIASDNVHLGLTDQTSEGQWYWQSGTNDAELMWSGGNSGSPQNGFYNNWNGSEPNDHLSDEDHAVMFYVTGLWNDAKPFENYRTLIEWDADDLLASNVFNYAIQSDPAGAYAIAANSGVLSVANGSAIDFETAASDDITVRVTNAHGDYHDEVITINVTDVPSPIISNIESGVLSYTENDGAVPITATLTISDADNTTLQSATVTIRDSHYFNDQDALQFTDYGPFTSNWDAVTGVLTINGPATIAEWQNALRTVTYTNSSDDPLNRGLFFDFTVFDGFEHSTAAHRQGSLIAVNDAPTLGNGIYADIPEDVASPAGITIEDIFAGQFSDLDGTFVGIGITGNAATSEGTWEYSIDSGATWSPVGSVSTSAALMLDINKELRFVPAAHYFGSAPALTVVGVDSSYSGSWTGVTEARPDLTTRGGSTALSQDTSVIQPYVTPVGPTDLATGVALNTDGGNDAYLLADDGGALLGGLDAITIETQFAIETAQTFSPLLSYATPLTANDLLLAIQDDGAIFFHINDERIDVPGSYPELLDGSRHSLAVSWDSLHGDIAFYVNGHLIHAATGLQAGYMLNAAGALVFGQDQDSVNGSYDPDQQLQGTLFDVRIWSEARTFAEIAQTHHHRLHTDALPATLIANWQMDGFDGADQIVDVVSGNNLSVAHITRAPFTAGTASATLKVSEAASDGTVVSYLVPQSSTHVDDLVQDGRFTFAGATAVTHYTAGTKIGGASGFWQVDAGDIGVEADWPATPLGGKPVDLDGTEPGAISQTLNTTPGQAYQLRFAFTGNFTDAVAKSMTVSVGDATETFTLDSPTGWAFNNPLWNQRSLTFNASADSTTLSFVSNSTSGSFGPVIADVQVVELPDSVAAILAADNTLTYDAGTAKFYRAVSAPESWTNARDLAIAAQLNGVSGQLVTISSAYENSLVQSLAAALNSDVHIGASDATTEGDWRWQRGYEDGVQFWSGPWSAAGGGAVTGTYSNWNTLEPNNAVDEHAALMRHAEGTWNDVVTTRVKPYVVEWDANAVLSAFQYSLQSDPSGAFSIDATTGALTISNASAIDFESATSHDIIVRVTDAVDEFYDETLTIQVNDAAGPVLAGIETTALSYVENSGAVAISDSMTIDTVANSATISFTSGYVAAEDTLTFIDTPSIFHSWDAGNGILTLSGSGTTAEWQLALRSVTYENNSEDPTGGNRAVQFSSINSADTSNSVSRAITVTPVNDAPTIAATSPLTVAEDDTDPVGHTVSAIFSGLLSDVDGSVLGIAISNDATTTEGQWKYSTDSGGNWYPLLVAVSETNAVVLDLDSMLRFEPATDYHGAIPALTAVAVDDSQGGTVTADNLRAVADVSSKGGATAFSSASAQIEGTVTPVFDAPENVGSVPASFTVSEDSSSEIDLSDIEIDPRDHTSQMTLRLSTTTGGLLAARSDPSVLVVSNSGSIELTASATSLNTYLNDSSSILYLHGSSHTHGAAADTLVIELLYGSSSDTIANPPIHISSVNDAPQTADSRLSMVEDTPYTLAVSDFEFSDPIDGDNLLNIEMVSVPLNVDLQLNGVAVNDGDSVPVTAISAGSLVLHPPHNTFGNNYDTLTYRVQDDGGVINSGDDLSDTVATLTLDIAAVNDSPDLIVTPVSLLRGESTPLTGHIDAIDPDVEDVQRLITLNTPPSQGLLQLNGTTLAVNDTFSQADVDAGALRYLHNGSPAVDDTIALVLADQGSDASVMSLLKILNISVTETHPQPQPDSSVVDEGESVSIPVLDNDLSADDPLDALSVAIVQSPLHGGTSIDANGVITYEHGGSETTADSFSYSVADSGGQVSDPVSVSVTINPVNDIPELTINPNGPDVTEQSAPVIVSPALRIVDAELSLSDNFDGSTLQLQRATGADAADQFSAAAAALGALTDGAALTLNSQTVGSILHNAGGSLLLQFNAAATGNIVNEVANSIGYTYNGDTPPDAITLQWLFNDVNNGLQGKGGAQGVSGDVALDITAINDPPVLSVGSGIPVYTEGDAAVTVAPLINITDAELDLLDSAAQPVITLERTTGAQPLDEFVASGQLGPLTAAAAFTDNSVRLGTILDNSEGRLHVAFDTGINTSQISSALQQIAYRHLGEAPPPQISLQWSFSDGNSGAQGDGGAAVGAVESLVTIIPIDDAPVISGLTSTTLPYSHRSPALPVLSGIELNDPDSTVLTRASVWVEDYQPGLDVLALTPTGGLTLNWDADIGVLTLEGPADLATYQSVLGTLTYRSVDLPAATETLRQLKLNITDDSGTSSDTELVELLLTIPENPLTLTVNQGLQIFTGDQSTIEVSQLAAVDIYSTERPATSIEFQLTEAPNAGALLLNDQPISVGDVFTQQDIQQGKLVYQHTAGTTGWDQFSFDLRDGNEDGAIPIYGNFEIEIRAPLEFVVNNNWSMLEGGTITLTTDQIAHTGGYIPAADLLIIADSSVGAAEFLDTTSTQVINQFTPHDIESGAVALRHDGSEQLDMTLQLALHQRVGSDLALLDTRTVDLTIVDVADSPMGADSTVATDHITAVAITEQQIGFDDTDDGDVLKALQITDVPQHGTLQLSNVALEEGAIVSAQQLRAGQLVYVPDPLTSGTVTDSFHFTLTDSGDPTTGGSIHSIDANTIEIVVTSDHQPKANPDKLRVAEGGLTTQLETGATRVTDNDTDRDTPIADLLVQLLQEPTAGALTLNQDGTFSYQHDGSETQSDSFTYRVVDDETELSGTSGSVTTVQVAIEPRNDAPEAGVVASQWLQTNEILQLELPNDLFTDRDPADTLTLSATLADGSQLPPWLNFNPATASFSGTPDTAVLGTLEILVIATDVAGATAESRFEITVGPLIAEATEAPLPYNGEFDHFSAPAPVAPSDNNQQRSNATIMSNQSLTLASEASAKDDEKSDEAPLERDSTALPEIPADTATREPANYSEDRVVRHRQEPSVENAIIEDTDTILHKEVVELQQFLSVAKGQTPAITDVAIQELNRIREEMRASSNTAQAVVVSSAMISTGLSVGYILWLIRGGVLLSSVMTSMPAWRFIDPLPVLHDLDSDNEDDDQESLESLVDGENSNEASKRSLSTDSEARNPGNFNSETNNSRTGVQKP